jgi:hypothetical protein
MVEASDPLSTFEVSAEAYLRATPTDEETAHRAVDPYRALTSAGRWHAFREVLREADALLAGAEPFEDDRDPFWRRWMDPSLGCPR